MRRLIVLVALAAAGCASGSATPARACAPPRGPNDTAVHSRDLRVAGVSCSVGRRVALACTDFTYGHSGICSAAGERWHCTSTKPDGSESAQRCVAGRKRVSILWLD